MQSGKKDGLDLELRANGVLLLTIDRPEHHNALNDVLHSRLAAVWREIDQDPNVRVAVITGRGAAFSVGGDIETEKKIDGNYDNVLRVMNTARELVHNILSCDKPIISAINGPAAGAGLAIALLSDIPLIADGVRFTDAHARIGLAAGDHAAMLWPLACGIANAKYYLMTADSIDAQEAHRLGFVVKVCPADELLQDALQLADRLATGSQSAIQFTKRSINQWLRIAQPTFELSLALEMINLFGDDVREGLKAFTERRAPTFPSGAT